MWYVFFKVYGVPEYIVNVKIEIREYWSPIEANEGRQRLQNGL